MKAYVRQAERGSDTMVPMPLGFDAVFPISALEWLSRLEQGYFMDGTEKSIVLIVKFGKEEDAEELVSSWNNRN